LRNRKQEKANDQGNAIKVGLLTKGMSEKENDGSLKFSIVEKNLQTKLEKNM